MPDWISASGAIAADSGRDFQQFAKGRDLSAATVVLDSDGGSVLGAIALGREIRRLALAATVGRVVDLAAGAKETPRATLSPRGDCESMCAFVLLAGVRRSVPPEARVMVHQIWLGDRRDDPTAANYSAEDLVLVQRDIGRLAQYTAEMGASTELLGLALRIPPWEPMHSMTAEELRSTRLATDEAVAPAAATIAAAPPPSEPQPAPRATSGITNNLRASPISETHWAVIDRDGAAVLARHHPLTVEGEDLGSFDLAVACGAGGTSYDVSYSERRHSGERRRAPAELARVILRVGDGSASLKVASSERGREPDELVSYAAATGAGRSDRQLCFERQSFAGDRNREQRHGHGHPAGQYRRAAEPAAAGRKLQQGAGRPRRTRADQENRRPRSGAIRHFHYRFTSRRAWSARRDVLVCSYRCRRSLSQSCDQHGSIPMSDSVELASDTELDDLQATYKTAVEHWIAAIRKGRSARLRQSFGRGSRHVGGRAFRRRRDAQHRQSGKGEIRGRPARQVLQFLGLTPPPVCVWPRSDRRRSPRRRRSAGWRRGAPCSRAPARARRCRPICRTAAGRSP